MTFPNGRKYGLARAAPIGRHMNMAFGELGDSLPEALASWVKIFRRKLISSNRDVLFMEPGAFTVELLLNMAF